MKTTCHIATYRNLGRSKKKIKKGHSSKNKNNPGDPSIRRSAGRLRAPRCAAWRGAERCGARGQGLLGGTALRLALEGGKRIKKRAGSTTLCPEASTGPPRPHRRSVPVPACAPQPPSSGAVPRRARRRSGAARPYARRSRRPLGAGPALRVRAEFLR